MHRENTYIDYIDSNIMPFTNFIEYPDRYPALSIQAFDNQLYEELRTVSKQLFDVFTKVCKILQKNEHNILKDIGISENLINYMNIPNVFSLPTWLSRLDYVLDKDYNLKFVEINADTPCAFVEAYYGNQVACNYFNKVNPNESEYANLVDFMHNLNSRLITSVDLKCSSFSKSRPVLFSCFDDYMEDLGTTRFLMEAMNKADTNKIGTIFESFYNLWIDDDGLILSNGIRPQAIYRMHPLELLANEMDITGNFKLGKYFLDNYAKGKFVMLNPPESIILQVKSFQTIVWQLANIENSILNQQEKATVNKYMIPTFTNKDDVVTTIDKLICKPIYGREGLKIQIKNTKTSNVIEETDAHDHVPTVNDDDCIYQEYIEQPLFKVDTDSGHHDGYITLSCFMLANKPSAVYGRFSLDSICSTDAYWLPLCNK